MGTCPMCQNENEDLLYCEVCGEVIELKDRLLHKLKANTTNQESETINKTIDELIELSQETQRMKDKKLIIESILSERKLHQVTTWRLFCILQGINGQTQHLEEWEKKTKTLLRNDLRFSFESIALILGRSKETVFRYSKKGEVSDVKH